MTDTTDTLAYSDAINDLTLIAWAVSDGQETHKATRMLVRKLEDISDRIGVRGEMSDAINAVSDVARWDHLVKVRGDRDYATTRVGADPRELRITERDALKRLQRALS